MSDTIAAIATGGVLSAIGIVRLSGDDTLAVLDRVFVPASGAAMSRRPDRQLVYGRLLDADGALLDLCLATVSRGPSSYTGEDCAELQCHGSPTMLRQALEALFAAGARQALPGEFTKRAFLNGKLDLTQAEAVIDLIHAETAEAARHAAGQLDGALLRRARGVYDALGDISAHYHAVLDYPDEDIDEFRMADYEATLERCEQNLQGLLDSFSRGKLLQSGVPAVLLGRPNAGKSTLLNALLGYERAIVTPIAGTTRDTITERARLGKVLLRLTDTAGLRETGDEIERLGVERSRRAMEEAALILCLTDAGQPLTAEDEAMLAEAVSRAPTVWVRTKSDLPALPVPDLALSPPPRIVELSAATGEGLDALTAAVEALFPAGDIPAGEILTNARQADAVGRALESLRAARAAMALGSTPDIVLTETETAMAALGELTGASVREDVTARIFERFCVGK